ncbi:MULTISPECIES: LacI family DNA-binding transcriptional regulator [unclassified Caballeronia]|uniref:LacI family DNA-binding transcriptional regulator n=1 Tax=unclassified Caballeronia TaxID=2646786 RepID=UPI00285A0543|nr:MULTISPECIES: LacI family DNA-binding transcriptional regulator [unclassified Caballeronia]MDR5740441.1 LacI family DNA-binding transcriptional regulator [Caballeronia sp. LZ016]MDR5809038.1 LacI family DNA-binding transcriptional regulator [Caballeronia sp. LZ019]
MKKMSPTIRDVAAAAGVSVATVSKYINGAQRFSAPVEARLKEAIATLGYRSNPLARSMITGRTRTIGLTILDISNPHFTNVVKGANRIALRHDYTLLLVDIDEQQARERPLIEALSQRVDGLIVSSRLPDDEARWMLDLDKPVVLLRNAEALPIPSVGIDNRLASHMLARHLLNLGHRHIAYLGFGQARINDERIRGVRECLEEAGLELDVHDAHAPTALAGEHACSRVMLGPKRPQAVICYNDLIALGFMKEAATLGIRVPQDVSVTGIDNVPYGAYAAPGLTTIDIQSEKMGELAMQKLIDALAGHPDPGNSMFEPRLIVRESTASAAGRTASA